MKATIIDTTLWDGFTTDSLRNLFAVYQKQAENLTLDFLEKYPDFPARCKALEAYLIERIESERPSPEAREFTKRLMADLKL